MKKIFTGLLLSILLAIVSGGDLWAQFAGGDGTASSPWQIATATQLHNVRDYLGAGHSDKHFIQTADIDIGVSPWNEGEGWAPIGFVTYYPPSDHPFSGNYDGGGHTLSGLYINTPDASRKGLFGFTDHAQISNLNITSAQVNVSIGGALVGYCDHTSVSNCHGSGMVEGYSNTGGLIGETYFATLSDCSFAGTVTALTNAGGLVGSLGASSLTDCFSSAHVNAGDTAEGLAACGSASTIRNSYYDYENVLINGNHYITIGALGTDLYNIWMANGKELNIDDYLSSDGTKYLIGSVLDFKYLLAFGQFEEYNYKLTADLDLNNHPDFYVPYLKGDFEGDAHQISNLSLHAPEGISAIGLFGHSVDSIIRKLMLIDVDVNGYKEVGGLVGSCRNVTILNCHVTGNVSGTENVGGLIGICEWSMANDCSSAATVVSTLINVGGLIGANFSSEISTCYSSAQVEGVSNVGGFTGYDGRSLINNSYCTGHVSGISKVGGFTALNAGSTITNCYSIAEVQGTDSVGGMVGKNDTTMPGYLFNSYWDMEISGQSLSAGGSGRTTAEMTWPYAANTYENWNFDTIWTADTNYAINSGYPYLPGMGSISTEDELSPVHDPALSLQIYPNPFNPSTTIEFYLPAPSEVQICIYNLKGQKVRQLSRANYESGRQSLIWDGKDDHGSAAGSGNYFCRLVTDSQIVTCKMLLLK